MICEGLRTLLLAESTVTAVTSAIYVSAARQNASKPYIMLELISDQKHKSLGGYLGARHCEIDIECWASTPEAAGSLAKIVTTYLDDFTGATGGDETILSSHHMDENNSYENPESGTDVTEFVTILNFEFHYTE